MFDSYNLYLIKQCTLCPKNPVTVMSSHPPIRDLQPSVHTSTTFVFTLLFVNNFVFVSCTKIPNLCQYKLFHSSQLIIKNIVSHRISSNISYSFWLIFFTSSITLETLNKNYQLPNPCSQQCAWWWSSTETFSFDVRSFIGVIYTFFDIFVSPFWNHYHWIVIFTEKT